MLVDARGLSPAILLIAPALILVMAMTPPMFSQRDEPAPRSKAIQAIVAGPGPAARPSLALRGLRELAPGERVARRDANVRAGCLTADRRPRIVDCGIANIQVGFSAVAPRGRSYALPRELAAGVVSRTAERARRGSRLALVIETAAHGGETSPPAPAFDAARPSKDGNPAFETFSTLTKIVAMEGLSVGFGVVPMSHDMLLAEGAFNVSLSRHAKLAIGYTGHLAPETRDHAVKGSFALDF